MVVRILSDTQYRIGAPVIDCYGSGSSRLEVALPAPAAITSGVWLIDVAATEGCSGAGGSRHRCNGRAIRCHGEGHLSVMLH